MLVQRPFESHIVLEPSLFNDVKELAKLTKFSTSFIVGDDELGDRKLLYLTKRASSFEELLAETQTFVSNLKKNGFPVLRYKLEVTLVDTK